MTAIEQCKSASDPNNHALASQSDQFHPLIPAQAEIQEYLERNPAKWTPVRRKIAR
jgi:hypothetical protein